MTPARHDLNARAFRFAEAVLRDYARLAAGGPAQAHVTEQLFRAVSSIGANLEEGQVASSRRDMAGKYAIALRESREARYWLRLIASQPGRAEELRRLVQEATEFVAMLTVSVRRLRTPPDGAPRG